MNLKSKSIIQLTMQLLAAVLLFVDGTITYKAMQYDAFSYDGPASFFWKMGNVADSQVVGTIALAFMIVTSLIIILQIVNQKSYKFSIAPIIVQIICFEVFFNNYLYTEPGSMGYHFNCERGPLSYLITAILVIFAVYTLISNIKTKKEITDEKKN